MDEDRLQQALAARRAVQSCTACPLRSQATAPIPWTGPLDATYAVLGEAPGRTEDREGKPFVGVAGRFLRGNLSKLGFNPDEFAYINSANCYPSITKTPTLQEIETCQVHLAGQLLAVRPKFLLVLGATALTALIGNHLSYKEARGRPFYVERLGPWQRIGTGITCFCTFHPAARSPVQRAELVEHLKWFRDWAATGAEWPSSCVGCGEEMDVFDEFGYPWCRPHAGKQMNLV